MAFKPMEFYAIEDCLADYYESIDYTCGGRNKNFVNLRMGDGPKYVTEPNQQGAPPPLNQSGQWRGPFTTKKPGSFMPWFTWYEWIQCC